MAQLVDSLSGLPGRKVFLYVGGGMSLRPGESMMRAFMNKYPRLASQFNVGIFDTFEQDTTRLFEQLVQRANAHRVTFYTLAANTGVSRASAEWGDNSSYTADLESVDRMNTASPLETLAAGTGGLAAYDSDPSVLMSRMREDLGSYYSLGYVPPQEVRRQDPQAPGGDPRPLAQGAPPRGLPRPDRRRARHQPHASPPWCSGWRRTPWTSPSSSRTRPRTRRATPSSRCW